MIGTLAYKTVYKFICASNTLMRVTPNANMQKSALQNAVRFSDYTTFRTLVEKDHNLLKQRDGVMLKSVEFSMSAYEWVRQGKIEVNGGNHWTGWWSDYHWEAPKNSLKQCRTNLIDVLKSAQHFEVAYQKYLLNYVSTLSLGCDVLSNATQPVSDVVLEHFTFCPEVLPWVLEQCVTGYQKDGNNIPFCSEAMRDQMLQKYWKDVDWMATADMGRSIDKTTIAPSWKDVIASIPPSYAIALLNQHPHIATQCDFALSLMCRAPVNEEIIRCAVDHGLSTKMLNRFNKVFIGISEQHCTNVLECIQHCENQKQNELLCASLEEVPKTSEGVRKRKM